MNRVIRNPKALISPFLAVVILIFCNSFEVKLSNSILGIDKTSEAIVLTAFFGLDNALPLQSAVLYSKAPGKDGMPVVFSQEIDPETLDSTDFEITSANGTRFGVEFVTLRPANEEYELRTVLLIGEFGNHPDNPPISVKIIGDLNSYSGNNYRGQSVSVIPLDEGPVLSYAEYFTFTEDYPYVEKGRGCDCPREETQMIVRTVWAGGVRAVNGNELGQNQLNDFKVTMVQGLDTIIVKPFQLADLNDNDNNIDLCLKESGIPILVKVNENIAIDPRGDKNPITKAKINSR